MLEKIYVGINLLLLIALVSSAWHWLRLLSVGWRLGPRGFLEALLEPRARSRPFWSPIDALVMFGALLLIPQLLVFVMISLGWMEWPSGDVQAASLGSKQLIASILASSVGGLVSIGIVLAWLRLFDPAARRKIGLSCNIVDATLGLKASLMILPPVLLISAAVTYFIPYEHPVLESLTALSTPAVFAVTFLGTAIVTPIVEEFLLRGMLQGGLQGLADQSFEEGSDWRPRAFWPIFVASLIFSLLHVGQGAAPIPLFFLSLGLGFLYRQTGNLTSPIVVHMVLNGLTLIAEVTKPAAA